MAIEESDDDDDDDDDDEEDEDGLSPAPPRSFLKNSKKSSIVMKNVSSPDFCPSFSDADAELDDAELDDDDDDDEEEAYFRYNRFMFWLGNILETKVCLSTRKHSSWSVAATTDAEWFRPNKKPPSPNIFEGPMVAGLMLS